MAIKTTTSKAGRLAKDGWNHVTIKSAEYGSFNDTRYIDVFFEEFPDYLNLRIYEGINKESGEEFAIANLFKFANAGIIDALVDDEGKSTIITYDDDTKHLVGKTINAYVYRNEEGYQRVLRKIAPDVFEGEHVSYTESDHQYWKDSAEKYYENNIKAGTAIPTDTQEHTTQVPF